jgi:hypothetical protein
MMGLDPVPLKPSIRMVTGNVLFDVPFALAMTQVIDAFCCKEKAFVRLIDKEFTGTFFIEEKITERCMEKGDSGLLWTGGFDFEN